MTQQMTQEMTQETTTSSNDTLARLAAVIESRKLGDPDKSYVARLFHKGNDAILKKIGEEATEVVMACKDGEGPKIVGEVADLWFHCMLALSAYGLEAGRCARGAGAPRRPVGPGRIRGTQGRNSGEKDGI